MDYLRLKGKKILIFGVANKRSVAYFIAKSLMKIGAEIVLSVKNEEVAEKVRRLFENVPVYCCDLKEISGIENLKEKIGTDVLFSGIVHSVAYANYNNIQERKIPSFYETQKRDFFEALDISCFSLIHIAKIFKNNLTDDASVVTISISTTRMAAENYGYMAPIKAALDSCIVFLAKSFSSHSNVRFNAVGAGLLKTSSSAAIPGYINSYLFAEKVIPRKRALSTQEVADVAIFLLSPISSGINAQKIIVDAGMSINYFDKEIVESVNRCN